MPAEKRRHIPSEATSGHKLFENIAYIAMYTAGGNLWRLRVSRSVHAVTVFTALVIVSFINAKIARASDFSENPAFQKAILGFYFSLKDVLFFLVHYTNCFSKFIIQRLSIKNYFSEKF